MSPSLSQEHRAALEWFAGRQGEEIDWPEPIDGLFLVEKAKGIRVPKGWPYALSIRQTLGSTYPDQPPQWEQDGGWTYRYHQEGDNPADRDRFRTNRALMNCLADGVPVAVLVQTRAKPTARYRVMGLARVNHWEKGYFELQSVGSQIDPAAAPSPDLSYDTPAATLPMATMSGPIDPTTDARRRIAAEIVIRQGGAAFRREALKHFGGRCAISGYAVRQVLEAAHIVPYLGEHTNTSDNALLLRADLHTLFDCELLTIDPATLQVRLADQLLESPYAEYAGNTIEVPPSLSGDTLRARLLERSEALKTSLSA